MVNVLTPVTKNIKEAQMKAKAKSNIELVKKLAPLESKLSELKTLLLKNCNEVEIRQFQYMPTFFQDEWEVLNLDKEQLKTLGIAAMLERKVEDLRILLEKDRNFINTRNYHELAKANNKVKPYVRKKKPKETSVLL